MSSIKAYLVCGEDLEYFDETKEMTWVYCKNTFMSNASCINNHYVCDTCHSQKAIESIIRIANESTSKNPVEIAVLMMNNPYVHMHGPENHVLVGSALLAAYKNSGGKINLKKSLEELKKRGSQVPGGVCGNWGCCGAAVSSGIFTSIITGSNPLANEAFSHANRATSICLEKIAEIGGPRCCKRNGILSIINMVKFCDENFGIKMQLPINYTCQFTDQNKQCIAARCPFFPKN